MNVKVLVPSLLALAVSANLTAAEFEFAGNSTLKLGGDLELDTDVRDNASNGDKWDQNGRILLDIEAEKVLDNGTYFKAKAQPLLKTNGDVDMDDAFGEFGVKDDWYLRAGRYEAINLYPLGQDTFVDFATDNNSTYVYEANIGRGRSNDAGQVTVSKTFGNVYTELSSLFGKAENMDNMSFGLEDENLQFNGSYTHIVRPAVQYRGNGWNVTLGAEIFVSDEQVQVKGGEWLDLDDRTGYAATFNYLLPWGDLNVNYSYLDSSDFEATSYGFNTTFGQWGVGYIYGENQYSGVLVNEQDSEVNTIYASYIWDKALSIDNFQMHFGAFYSEGEFSQGPQNDDDEIGGRIRLKYFL